jgi:hypothetical protein
MLAADANALGDLGGVELPLQRKTNGGELFGLQGHRVEICALDVLQP